jgi:hypothetical protein
MFSDVETNGVSHQGFSGIIKHRDTEEYYRGQGRWGHEEEEAMTFTSLHVLAEEARRYNIKDCCEFILKLVGQPGMVVFLPL